MYDNDDWGETYEDESDNQWETQDNSEQYFDTQDAYSAEVAQVWKIRKREPTSGSLLPLVRKLSFSRAF